MTEMGDAFREYRRHKQKQKQHNRRIAYADFDKAVLMAKFVDMCLSQYTEAHYQLTVYLSHKPLRFWIYNLYPGNQRIYSDRKHRGPFLDGLKVGDWTFEQIIVAAKKAREKYLLEKVR